MIGKQIHHYKILEKLGSGGMGEVYLAEDTKLKRKVALKFLPPGYSADSDFKARFKHEAQATAALNHPHIITVHDIDEHQGRMYLVLEHVPGKTLEDVIESGKLKLAESLDLMSQICEGLAAAHKAGIIHRDIKPSNILISAEGQAKILDFGLAKMSGVTKLTKEGSTLGTLQYQSPEQSRGETVDERSDIFSVGVTLYEMITGHLPFEADYDVAVRYAISYETPEPMARYKSGVSDDLQRIVDKALAKDPAHRYQHADEMLADLKRLGPTEKSHMIGVGTWAIAGATILILTLTGYFLFNKYLAAPQSSETQPMRIAVLPFENLGSADDEYFADGITDEITSRLARISGLRVISRTSAMKYKNTDKTIPQIGEELGVDYILEGTILWDKSGDTDRVRITPQLIEVASDFHVWSDNIERPLTKLFSMQANIAIHITEALNVTLLEPERRAVEAAPTENMEAYDYYVLGGNYVNRSFDRNDNDIAIEMFEKAVALDSNFALGYAKLSKSLCEMYWIHSANEHTLQRAKLAIDRALELAPDDPLVREALARYYYHGHRDYERALGELALARRSLPDDPEILATIGFIKRRQGRLEEALEYLERAVALNPRSAKTALEIGHTYLVLRRYDLAEDWFDRAISLSPDWAAPHNFKSFLCLLRDGNNVTARKALEVAGKTIGAEELASQWALCERFARNYEGALDRLPADGYLMTRGRIYYLMNDTITSAAYFDSARIFLHERESYGLKDAGEREAYLGITFAYLNRPEDAIKLGRQAMDILPVSLDAFLGGTRKLIANVEIHIVLGDYDRAIDLLERLLSIPSEISAPFLRGHPLYDPLRENPRFKEMMKKYQIPTS